jgi:putative Mg2+ transporter-C (MgtC) family protein
MGPGLDLTIHTGEPVIFLRLLIATLAGAAVAGTDIEPASPRVSDHTSAIFVAIPISMSALRGGDGATRVIQGVAAGIGVLGAGEIFLDPSAVNCVYGLPSAATLWVTAALGILAVCGSGSVIVVATSLVLAILYVAPRLEHQLPAKARSSAGTADRGA